LEKISEICLNKKISLHLEKIQAHSGIPRNEIADQLAKIDPNSGMNYNDYSISLNTANNHLTRVKAKWINTNIDIPIKNLCQIIFKAKNLAQWRLLNRS
jgi:hypothetical protein